MSVRNFSVKFISPAGIVFLFSRKNTVVRGSVRVTSLSLVSDLTAIYQNV